MARKDKYYGTDIFLHGDKMDKMKELGYKGTHCQFRIVCKAKSRTEANRIAESYDLGKKVFQPDYTSETGNEIEIEMANKYNFIICLNGTLGDHFIGLESIL